MFGITDKDIPKGKWQPIELPDPKAKVAFYACDNAASFCMVVSDKGVIYFGGLNKKGEAGENRKINHMTVT